MSCFLSWQSSAEKLFPARNDWNDDGKLFFEERRKKKLISHFNNVTSIDHPANHEKHHRDNNLRVVWSINAVTTFCPRHSGCRYAVRRYKFTICEKIFSLLSLSRSLHLLVVVIVIPFRDGLIKK